MRANHRAHDQPKLANGVRLPVMRTRVSDMAFDSLKLRRQSDSRVYAFTRVGGDGRGSIYVRSDGMVQIVYDEAFGWSIWDSADGALVGRVWSVPPERQAEYPTAGTWVSRKGSKSYVYELTYE